METLTGLKRVREVISCKKWKRRIGSHLPPHGSQETGALSSGAGWNNQSK